MNILKITAFLILSALLLCSCEDIIILDLEDETPRAVIEAKIDASLGSVRVIVSSSNAFYEEGQQNLEKGATVSIINQEGDKFFLDLNEEGTYTLENLEVESGKLFTVQVELDNELYEASSEVPYPVELLNIDTSIFQTPFGGGDGPIYQIYTQWQDLVDVPNYYRIKTYKNGEYEKGSFILYNDLSSDGLLFTRPIMQFFMADNFYKIELLSMDGNSFDYFQQLSTIQSQGGGSSVPFNPKGNFSNDALGYFEISFSSSIEVQL